MQLGKKYNVKLLSRLFAGFLILGEISISQIPKCFITFFLKRLFLFPKYMFTVYEDNSFNSCFTKQNKHILRLSVAIVCVCHFFLSELAREFLH